MQQMNILTILTHPDLLEVLVVLEWYVEVVAESPPAPGNPVSSAQA